jgi:hypothetical protein
MADKNFLINAFIGAMASAVALFDKYQSCLLENVHSVWLIYFRAII